MVGGGGPPSPTPTPPLETTLKPRPVTLSATVKFLCSYGGRIVPRHAGASLRYVGGVTRLLSVPRSLSFPELLVRLGELCGAAVFLRCQLPMEDLDTLVSITSDDDLANLIEEYDCAALPKIRAFLSLPKLAKPTSPPSSLALSSPSWSSSSSGGATVNSLSSPLFAKPAAAYRCLPQFMARRPRQSSMSPSLCSEKAVGKKLNHHPLVYGNSPPSSLASSSPSGLSSSSGGATVNSLSSPMFAKPAAAYRCLPQFMARRLRQSSMSPSLCSEKAVGKMRNHHPLVYGNYGHGNPEHVYLIHNGNHWQ